MSTERTLAMLDAVGDGNLWLLGASVVVCWGLVVYAMRVLFRTPSGGRVERATQRRQRPTASGKDGSAQSDSRLGGQGHA